MQSPRFLLDRMWPHAHRRAAMRQTTEQLLARAASNAVSGTRWVLVGLPSSRWHRWEALRSPVAGRGWWLWQRRLALWFALAWPAGALSSSPMAPQRHCRRQAPCGRSALGPGPPSCKPTVQQSSASTEMPRFFSHARQPAVPAVLAGSCWQGARCLPPRLWRRQPGLHWSRHMKNGPIELVQGDGNN